MLCFAIDNRDSLENIIYRWLEELGDHCPDVKIILVALKCDLRDDESTIASLQQQNIHPVLYEEVGFCKAAIKAHDVMCQ